MCEGLGQGLGQQLGQGGAFGDAGIGAGGEAPKARTPTQTRLERAQGQNDDADIIANLPFQGPIVKGESTAAFREAALSAARSYAENVHDDQIPRKYRDAMQHYFGDRLPRAAEGETVPPAGGADGTSSGGDTSSDGE